MMLVGCGEMAEKWHGIRAWSEELLFTSIWAKTPPKADGPWACFWTLVHPGVFDWKVPPGYETRPWHGCYFADELPANAAILDDADLKAFRSTQALD